MVTIPQLNILLVVSGEDGAYKRLIAMQPANSLSESVYMQQTAPGVSILNNQAIL